MLIFARSRSHARTIKAGRLVDLGKEAPNGRRWAKDVSNNVKTVVKGAVK